MFCKNCGAEIDDNAVVCPKCGVAVNETPAPAPASSNDAPSIGFAILSFLYKEYHAIVAWFKIGLADKS